MVESVLKLLVHIPIAIMSVEYLLYNILMAVLVHRKEEGQLPPHEPPITIIIPTYNEEKHIEKKLLNTLEIDYPRERYRIVVADDSSQDDTVKRAEGFKEQGVKVIAAEERIGKTRLLKWAFAQAETEIVVATDATVTIGPDAIRNLVKHFADPSVGAVTGRVTVKNLNHNPFTNAQEFLFGIQNAHKYGEARLYSAAGLYGQLMAVRLTALGDFRTDVIYEDREFGILITRNGYVNRFASDAVAYYLAMDNLNDFQHQKLRNSGSMIQSIFRHRRMLFNPRYGWYSMLIFPEYSLFRVMRSFLLLISYLAILAYGLLVDIPSAAHMFAYITSIVLFTYFLPPVILSNRKVNRPDLLKSAVMSVPVVFLLSLYFIASSYKYLRGDFSELLKKIDRK